MATEHNINKIVSREGQLWMNLIDLIDIKDDESEEEEIDDMVEDSNETMKLKREDMSLFGICPSRDQVYFVVCEHCKQVFKPQALVHHIERRHSNHVNNTSKLTQNNSNSLLKSSNGKSDLNRNINGNDSNSNSNSNSKVILNCSVDLNSKTTSDTRVLSQTRIDSVPLGHMSVNMSGHVPGQVSENMTNSNNTKNNSDETITITKTAKKKSSKKSGMSSKSGMPPTRKLLPCKDREYDANKHCGVWLPDMEKPCTRSLTCKTHSLTLRRAVQGRVKNFDELLAEHRAEKEQALRAQGIEIKLTKKDLIKQQRQQQQLLKQQQKLDKLESAQTLIKSNENKQNSLFSHSDVKLVLDSSSVNNNYPSNNLLAIATTSLLTTTSTVSSSVVSVSSSITSTVTVTSMTSVTSVTPTMSYNRTQHTQLSDMYINHHPRPAAQCNYNVRRVQPCFRLINREFDLTASVLMSTFCPTISKSVVGTMSNVSTINNSCSSYSSSTSSNSSKTPVRYNQLSAMKKLRIELTPLELQVHSQSCDPYNFPDLASTTLCTTSATPVCTTSATICTPVSTPVSASVSTSLDTTYTYIKPKTSITKNTSQNTSVTNSNRKRKTDINIKLISDEHSSLLNNGQISQQYSNKKSFVNSKRSNNKKLNNSIDDSNTNSITIDATNSQEQQFFHTPTSLINSVPHKNLNELLSNFNDTNDNGSILLNGSLLNYNNHVSIGKNKVINKSTSSTINTVHNKSLCNKGSTSFSTISTLSQQTKPSNKQMPLIIPNQSQQHSHTPTALIIKSTQQSSQNQLLSTQQPKFLTSKSDNFPT